jgi:hypothetical protein
MEFGLDYLSPCLSMSGLWAEWMSSVEGYVSDASLSYVGRR